MRIILSGEPIFLSRIGRRESCTMMDSTPFAAIMLPMAARENWIPPSWTRV